MNEIPEIVMVVLLAVMGYAWVVFPVVLGWVAGKRKKESVAVGGVDGAGLSVGVVFSAYNEEAHIAERIRNLLEEAPVGRAYEIHVGVDASSDDTAGAAQRAAAGHSHVHVHAFGQRRGKVAVIKDLVARCQAELLVFTDANTFFERGAMRTLLAHFGEPGIGGVCGRLALVAKRPTERALRVETDAGTDEGFYWRWETALKIRESAVDSCLGANGAIFAMRRELFWRDIPDNTMVDDFVIGMKVREQGARVLYEPGAVAVEELPHVRHEWGRRVRIGAGDYQALVFCRRCLLPRHGRFAWCFWSHKVLRWFTPHAALLLIPCAAMALVVGSPWGRVLGALCLAGLAATGVFVLLGVMVRDSTSRLARLPALCLHFVSMQAALFAGFLRYVSGDLTGAWKRTPRSDISD